MYLLKKTFGRATRINIWAAATTLLLGSLALNTPSLWAQSSIDRGTVQPMGQWADFAQTHYTGKPLRVHLRTGYERAVIMPEPVAAYTDNLSLPSTDVIVENEVVGFYPENSFEPVAIKFVGVHSGTVYKLVIRSSPTGTRQPLKVN